jgi:acetoacetyl-CoA synthetase
VNAAHHLNLQTYAQLHDWSVKNPEAFWSFYSRQSGIKYRRAPKQILSSKTMPGARWFADAELNYAENLLSGPPDKTAIIGKVEGKPATRMTFGQVSRAVSNFAAALEKRGVRPGDRVAGCLPNIPETVIAHLGAAAIGAVWSSCSPDFGHRGVVDRFQQIEPKILVCVDGYTYNGKPFSTLDTINTLGIPSLEHIVVIPFLDPSFEKTRVKFPSVFTWNEFCVEAPPFNYPDFPFNHPLCILYSSGTTGRPKCIVHGAGGTLLQHHKEHALHTDIGADDVVFYYTTCGWMMWNWLVSVLAQGATIVLYEGSPAYPSIETLWQLVEETRISVFGASPKFIALNRQQGLRPGRAADLSSLRTLLSTGSPLDKESFRWVYQQVKSDLTLSSISGGTDIISCFMLGNPMLPVRAGEIQCVGLGMDVVALDDQNRPALNQKGELACRAPAPSMPLYFWQDPGGKKYRHAYFDKVPGVWIHGDYIEINDHGGIIVYGRSDATLKPGGVRIGTAEIYAVIETMAEILDSLVIGVEEANDVTVILFVVLKTGTLDKSLSEKIKLKLRAETSPRHVPREIYQVQEIPRTINGKKLELTVHDIFKGEQPKHAPANPECLDEYQAIKSRRA